MSKSEFKEEQNIPLKGFVFSEYDRPLPPRIVEEYYTKYCEKGGIVHKSSHCSRKTYISSLADQGVNTKTIMRLVGHSSAKTTLNNYVYDRKSEEAQKAQIEDALNYWKQVSPSVTNPEEV